MDLAELEPLRDRLPGTFRYTDALRLHIDEYRLGQLQRAGLVEKIARGLYRRTDLAGGTADDDLVEVATKAPQATLCLTTALVRHGLLDDIPAVLDVALPRHSWRPKVLVPVRWHEFGRDTFEVGRDAIALDDYTKIGLYSAERSIVDAFRLAHREGSDVAVEALRRWLRAGGQPHALLSVAATFPAAEPSLRRTLEILL